MRPVFATRVDTYEKYNINDCYAAIKFTIAILFKETGGESYKWVFDTKEDCDYAWRSVQLASAAAHYSYQFSNSFVDVVIDGVCVRTINVRQHDEDDGASLVFFFTAEDYPINVEFASYEEAVEAFNNLAFA